MIVYHDQVEQGSTEWLAMRCGLITASEVNRIAKYTPPTPSVDIRVKDVPFDGTPAQKRAHQALYDSGWIDSKQAASVAKTTHPVIQKLVECGALETRENTIPASVEPVKEDDISSHVWELAAQRISNYVEPMYISDDMLRGHRDEVFARNLYAEKYNPVEQTGFVTNRSFGFTLGCSPDGLVGKDGMIECKSRLQKYQVKSIVEYGRTGLPPSDYMLQVQTQMLVADRQWCDLISWSGGLNMAAFRIERDPRLCDQILIACDAAEKKIKAAIEDYYSEVERLVLPETERYVEEEMRI